MKKILIIVGIIVAILVVAGLVTGYADSARVRNGVEPKFTIKIVTDGGNQLPYFTPRLFLYGSFGLTLVYLITLYPNPQ